ncbi:lactosylceramide 4-alpha-galactosyltransferase-like [Tachypleus tridentatus]|uniref:lactosylceramide 4-alpha-galactosyltransferase-like n=1 Tax=Tachypleus tridentatus TaxID=6853 RepID=UPI003FD1093E
MMICHYGRKRHQLYGIFVICMFLVILCSLAYWDTWTTGSLQLVRKENSKRKSKNVFFSETTGRCYMTTRESCAIESAAKYNPDYSVSFIYACNNVKQLRNNTLFQIISHIPNVQTEQLNFTFLFSKTPLAKWYLSKQFNSTKYKATTYSNGLRYVLLRKYGGITLDTDCISLKSLPNTPSFVGFESLTKVNNAVIKTQKRSRFIIECTERFVSEYNTQIWGYTGPELLTRIFKAACKREKKQFAPGFTCYDIHLFPVPTFYPTGIHQLDQFFNPTATSSVLKVWNDSYIVHIWNKLTKRRKFKPGDGSPMDYIYKKNCPATYSYILKQEVGN